MASQQTGHFLCSVLWRILLAQSTPHLVIAGQHLFALRTVEDGFKVTFDILLRERVGHQF